MTATAADRRGILTALAPAFALGLALTWLYRDTLISMAQIWLHSDTFAHGVIVVPVSAYLIWRRRAALRSLPARPDFRVLAALVVCVGLWLVARLVGVQVIEQFAVVAAVPVSVWLLFGRRIVTAIAFPLAYLIFAVPFGEALIPALMVFTADFTTLALELTGVPVYREGFQLMLPKGDFEVATACSGIRYLIASVALGSLYAYLTYRSYWRRALFIALSALVPVLANGVRAYGIVMLAHLSEMRYAVGVDHLIYGWLFFGVVMFLLFWAGTFFRDGGRIAQAERSARHLSVGPVSAHAAAAAVGIAVLASGPLTAAWADRPVPVSVYPKLPNARPGWEGPIALSGDWRPAYTGADIALGGEFRDDGARVGMHLHWYERPRQNRELINYNNRLHGQDWRLVSTATHSLGVPDGQALEVQVTRIRSRGEDKLIWSWYDIGGRYVTSPVAAKLWGGWLRLQRRARGSALIALEAADERALAEFVTTHHGAIRACLAGEGDCAG